MPKSTPQTPPATPTKSEPEEVVLTAPPPMQGLAEPDSDPFAGMVNLCETCVHAHIIVMPFSERQPELRERKAWCHRWPGDGDPIHGVVLECSQQTNMFTGVRYADVMRAKWLEENGGQG